MNFAAFHAFDDNTLLIARCCPNIREIKDIKEYAQLSSKSSTVAMLCICRVLYDICQDWDRVDEYFVRAIVASMSMNGEKPTSVDEQLRFVEGWVKSVFQK